MIEKLACTNFRCFKSIELSDCRRINLIVGRNAGGKTALLEGIFLASGASPALALRLKGWRGEDAVVLAAQPSAYEALWRDLFYMFDQREKINIRCSGSNGFSRSVTVFNEPTPEVLVPIGSKHDGSPNITPITFIYEDESARRYSVSPIIDGNAMRIPTAALPPLHCVFLPAQQPIPSAQYASFFSDLSKKNRQSTAVNCLRAEFPFIEDVTVEVSPAGQPMLYALVSILPEKVPLTLLSAGINKLLCVLLSMAHHPKGLVLIDEIENGFYYDRLPSMWSLVLTFAREHDVQVFATTHGRECLQALAVAAEGSENEFSLIRLSVNEEQHVEAEQFDGDTFIDALRRHGEIR
ncbi:MAG: AAA family ATPase [Pseudomonadota bacterium]